MKSEAINRAAARALLGVALLAAVVPGRAGAQEGRAQSDAPPPRPAGRTRTNTLRVELPTPVAQTPVPFEDGRAPRAPQTLSFVTPDTNFERKVVKGSPFSADAVTEHVQRLGDGNRLTRKSAARLFRDAEGRTRREHTPAPRGGGPAPEGQEPRLVVINDPVARVEYVVDNARRTVRKTFVPPGLAEARARATGAESSFGVLMPTSTAHRRMAEGENAPPPPAPKKEKLEARMIEGLMAEGTRTTVTIPAGEFDNEQPLEITHEQWYSPELQMVILLRHNDPRFGETLFRMTNITRAEPVPELFAEPQGYRPADDRRPPLDRPLIRRPPNQQ
ncbi:MAG TPA: hypothetical protein VF668_15695 [Pyrinomonadaceae bacterium]|jgi:hypothetical protein